MIEFSVELTQGCQKYLLNATHKALMYMGAIMGIVMSVPLTIISIFWPVTLLGTIPAMLLLLGQMIFWGSKKTRLFREEYESSIPQKILIDLKEETIERMGSGSGGYACNKLYDIKKILDYGEFYGIIFYFPNADRRFICQKDFIVQGTIEEFEQLFEGKIVRLKDNQK